MYLTLYCFYCRPHFALDMDTREEFFIELILSRHARKLLTSNCLYDLGLFAAHLDFDLQQWMAKERYFIIVIYYDTLSLSSSDTELLVLIITFKFSVNFTSNFIGHSLPPPHRPHPVVLENRLL